MHLSKLATLSSILVVSIAAKWGQAKTFESLPRTGVVVSTISFETSEEGGLFKAEEEAPGRLLRIQGKSDDDDNKDNDDDDSDDDNDDSNDDNDSSC
ncbi:hypothetical protein PHYSODRAFT_285142 [Phytophthora sojae]|uniref:RxLR effector protein n=2 Tax=Phytophthora sojae TaxID=67593 RepID=G4YVM9_PHYSP|nr:hypothetical protein PHYSODRAFT_285142 [Phytophthora sojae]AEK80954.1 Avh219 [Phytophthora sojae]AEK80955.1 Avh219 [Phytophthora sojae]AEK80956.1 Avh219 [Phytophthora sojae]EGZ26061.1 hypothetical protein PHYSODRAFT_285142 [Phytophthora sojae]|eukprot:XP_009521349.1 hypothetical protein PHYSODRAFT_285142 [Phytophthora sojae]